MSREKRLRVLRVGLPVLAALVLTGCPSSLAPSLSVQPTVISFGAEGVEESLAIFNGGGGTLSWTVAEDVPWLECDASSGSATTETDRVTLTATRGSLGPGTYNGTVVVSSNGGARNVPVSMRVPGTPQLVVSPLTLSFLSEETSAELTLENTGDEALSWSLVALNPEDPTSTISMPSYLEVSPQAGSIPAGGETTVTVELDREVLGEGTPEAIQLRVQSTGGTQTITLNISGDATAVLVVEPLTLDFGERLTQLTFDVYNDGPAGSELAFAVTTDRPEFILLNPTTGTSTGTTDLVKDKVTLSVTLDRTRLQGSEDGGRIFVTAPGFEPVEVLVTAKAAPIVFEGAINRTRPPFILRFVFTLRDSAGRAIDPNDPDVLEELQTAFTIYEDKVPLDTDETNFFVTAGRGAGGNLKNNLVLLLDYTGSMYNAGAGNGAVIAQMEASARQFVRDLPDSYRVAVMEYHERQQTNRLIHGFSTTHEAVVDSMEAFSVPAGEHGASEVLDAIVDAVERLEKEDENVLPFDDADVRSMVFISDGRDTSSIVKLEEAIRKAKDAGVRLYPIGFGQGINSAMLIQLASETGGHYYAAPTVQDLENLLGHEPAAGSPAADEPGLVATELDRQVVLTYITLWQEGNHTYMIQADYRGQTGYIDRDSVYAIGGDIRAGQIALTTAGIESDDTAEVFVRTDYVPRNVTQFRIRIVSGLPYSLDLAEDGLLTGWTVVNEGGGVYTVLTTEDRPLRYGAFGNLLKLKFSGAGGFDAFGVGFRVDNRIYVNPPYTKFFQYPGGILVTRGSSSTASVAPILLEWGFDPDAPGAWDYDEDSFSDFEDLFPDDPEHH